MAPTRRNMRTVGFLKRDGGQQVTGKNLINYASFSQDKVPRVFVFFSRVDCDRGASMFRFECTKLVWGWKVNHPSSIMWIFYFFFLLHAWNRNRLPIETRKLTSRNVTVGHTIRKTKLNLKMNYDIICRQSTSKNYKNLNPEHRMPRQTR